MDTTPGQAATEKRRGTLAHNAVLPTEEVVLISPPISSAEALPASAANLPLVRRVVAFGFLLIAEFFYGWAWNTVDVLRPFIRTSLGLSLTRAGSAYSAQGAGALIGAVVLAQLADRLGRRNMLVVVMVGYGTSLLSGVLVASYLELLLQRFILGVFLGGSFPIVVGIYVGLFQPAMRGKLASAINATFSTAIITLGFAFGHLGHHDWRLLLWAGGIPPILLAGLAYLVIPGGGPPIQRHARLPITEMFASAVRRQTLLLALLTGLNFFAYQAFSGWLTTYLKDERALPSPSIGRLVAAQFAGNILGGFFWGWAGDRFGRRFGAIGFFIAAAMVICYLTVPSYMWLLLSLGFAYGFDLAASVVWGPWLAELYPTHLRSTASSIFNWGRLVSFFAPLITGALGSAFGLRASMMVASIVFAVAASIWLLLPETLGTKNAEPRPKRPAPAL